jgi:diguanylate cyclase (GGDEF)-like protein
MFKKTINLRAAMILLVLLAIAPVAIFLAIQNVAIYRNNIAGIFSDTTALAQKLSSYPKEILPEPWQFVSSISQLPEMAFPLDCDGFQNIANSAMKLQPYFISATVFSSTGNRICPKSPQKEPVNISDREYFQKILQTKSYAISKLLIGRLSKTECIIFSQPILDERGNVIYVVNLGLDAKWLKTLLKNATKKFPVPSGTIAMVVDEAGTIVAATPDTNANVGQPVPDWDSIRPLFAKSAEVARQEAWLDGVHRATVYLPIFESPNGSVRMRVGIPIDPALKDAARTNTVLFSLIASVIFLAISLAWLVSTRMVLRPIHAIWSAAMSLRNGNLSTRVGKINATGELEELASAFDSMANQMQEEQKRLELLAMSDALTGLPNRYSIRKHLSQMIQRAHTAHSSVGLILLDLDGFKGINDSYGHPLGDKVLILIARALSASVNGLATLGRLGGDEFVLITECEPNPNNFVKLAQSIQAVLREPIVIDEHQFIISASMGIAVFPEHGDDMDTLIKNADVAMYRAKAEKMTGYCFYAPEMNQFTGANLRMQHLLSQAITKDELVLHYQPKIAALSGKITGAEALVRWDSEELGFVSPADFIPLAEETGFIVQIGEWVLKTACVQLREWSEEVSDDFSMAINFSPRQFADAKLIEKIIDVAKTSGVSVSQLELEITEGALMYDPLNATEALHKLRNLGAKVSIDDFGTGYSSLSYLKRLPIDALKVDKSFISGLPGDGADHAIVSAVIAIAQELDLKVTAEGVETPEQLDTLRKLGCGEFQGYLFSRPLPAADFSKMLRLHDVRSNAFLACGNESGAKKSQAARS